VRERGRAMAEAASRTATSMTAVIGGDADEVLAAIKAAGVWKAPATDNGKSRVRDGGSAAKASSCSTVPAATIWPLRDHLREVAAAMPTTIPTVALLSNLDGAVVADGREFADRLVQQVAHPVRWDLCIGRHGSGHFAQVIDRRLHMNRVEGPRDRQREESGTSVQP
jgi:[acyl-carrier-protein] S-malonyltransferase